MKKVFQLVLCIAFATTAFCQRPVEGDWLGTLNIGAELRIVFHITKNISGLSASMDSPDQGAKGIPVSEVFITGDSLHIKMDIIKGGFDGLLTTDTSVTGTWSQGAAQVPLTLFKTKTIVTLNRPQTPSSPFNYKSDDVEYDNADKSVHFGATLTYPSAGKSFPAAILISGSGQQDRDETIFEHKPFAVIADYLTRAGFAVLRVDDRGRGKSKGEVTTATSADFANDVEASITFLKAQPQIDINRIGLVGHSEGGLIAALVSSRRKDISFMILLASPGESGAALLAEQNAAILKSGGVDSTSADAYKTLFSQQLSDILSANGDTAIAFANAYKTYKHWKGSVSKNTLTALHITGNENDEAEIMSQVKGLNMPWLKYFLNSDAAKLFEKTNAKVLALNGEKDVQVIPSANLAGIEKALKKSKSKVYEVKMLPGLNHLFQHCNACTVSEYGKLEETFAPEALKIMGDWLSKNVQ